MTVKIPKLDIEEVNKSIEYDVAEPLMEREQAQDNFQEGKKVKPKKDVKFSISDKRR